MEEKSCGNCYWKFHNGSKWCAYNDEKLKENVCNWHNFKCQCGDVAKYKYKGKRYCSECILGEFEVEGCTTTNYYLDGEYLGDSDDIDEVIRNIDDDIERI